MSELLKEIEDDLRNERIERLWQRIGPVMVAISVAIVMATVAIVLWQNHRQSEAMRQTSQFIKGIDRLNVEDYNGAIAAFSNLTADDTSTYYGLAMLRKAQAQEENGDHDGAAKTYTILARRNTLFGGLAKMLTPPAAATAITIPDRSAPFYYTQSEWNAWQLLQNGKKSDAIAQFTALRDDNDAPYSQRARMDETLQYLAPEPQKSQDKTETTHDAPAK